MWKTSWNGSKRDASNEITEEKKKEKESNLPSEEENGEGINNSFDSKDKIAVPNFDLNQPVKDEKIELDDKDSIKKSSIKSDLDSMKEDLKTKDTKENLAKELVTEISIPKGVGVSEKKDQKEKELAENRRELRLKQKELERKKAIEPLVDDTSNLTLGLENFDINKNTKN